MVKSYGVDEIGMCRGLGALKLKGGAFVEANVKVFAACHYSERSDRAIGDACDGFGMTDELTLAGTSVISYAYG